MAERPLLARRALTMNRHSFDRNPGIRRLLSDKDDESSIELPFEGPHPVDNDVRIPRRIIALDVVLLILVVLLPEFGDLFRRAHLSIASNTSSETDLPRCSHKDAECQIPTKLLPKRADPSRIMTSVTGWLTTGFGW